MSVSTPGEASTATWSTMNSDGPRSAPVGPGTRRTFGHRRPRLIALVAIGGALGSVARYGIAVALPDAAALNGWPAATLMVNLVGAFALGFGLEALAQLGRETPLRRDVRLLGGTGFLGGFTTYSSFALQAQDLLAGGQAGVAIGYVMVSLVAGLSSCLAGLLLGARVGRARRRGTDPRREGAG